MRKNKFLAALAIAACLATAVPFSASAATVKTDIYKSVTKATDRAALEKIFNAKAYAEKNPDLKAAGITTDAALFNHFLTFGLWEGRECSDTFSVSAYKSGNPDLQKAFVDDILAYYLHYEAFGKTEKRTLVTVEACAKAGITVKNAATGAVISNGAAPAASTASSSTTESKVEDKTEATNGLTLATRKDTVGYDIDTDTFYLKKADDANGMTDGLVAKEGFVFVSGAYHRIVTKDKAVDSELYGYNASSKKFYDVKAIVENKDAFHSGVDTTRFVEDGGKYYEIASDEETVGFEFKEETDEFGNEVETYRSELVGTKLVYYYYRKPLTANEIKNSTSYVPDENQVIVLDQVYTKVAAKDAFVNPAELKAEAGKIAYAKAPNNKWYNSEAALTSDKCAKYYGDASKALYGKEGEIYYNKASVSASSKDPNKEYIQLAADKDLATGVWHEIVKEKDALLDIDTTNKYYLNAGKYYEYLADDLTALESEINGATLFVDSHVSLYDKYFKLDSNVKKDDATGKYYNTTTGTAIASVATSDPHIKSIDETRFIKVGSNFYNIVSKETATYPAVNGKEVVKKGDVWVYTKAVDTTKVDVTSAWVLNDGVVYSTVDGRYHKEVAESVAFDAANYGKTTLNGKEVIYEKVTTSATYAAEAGKVAKSDKYIVIKEDGAYHAHEIVKVEDAFDFDADKYTLVKGEDKNYYLKEK